MLEKCWKTIVRMKVGSLLILLLTLSTFARSWQPHHQEFFSLSFEKKQFTLREPIVLNLRIVNPSSADLYVDLGRDSKEKFHITVTDPQGKSTVLRNDAIREGISFFGRVRLEPEGVHTQTMVLNEWFQFQETGRYHVAVRLTVPLKVGDRILSVDTFSVGIDLTPRDPEKLAATCRSLVTRVQQARSVAPAMEAAHALSFVDDPVAVPFLEEILTDWRVVGHAIAGLRRIRSPEAIAVLIRALKITEHETALRARVALGLIAHETDDEATRSMITAVLKE